MLYGGCAGDVLSCVETAASDRHKLSDYLIALAHMASWLIHALPGISNADNLLHVKLRSADPFRTPRLSIVVRQRRSHR